jgi:GTPase SAR1 family protein
MRSLTRNVRVRQVQTHNVLLLGQSRMGKTTLLRSLTDASFVTKPSVWRGTSAPETHVKLFELEDGTFLNCNFIDTPGESQSALLRSRPSARAQASGKRPLDDARTWRSDS